MACVFGGQKPEAGNPLKCLQAQLRQSLRASDREVMRIDRDEKLLMKQLRACASTQHIETARLKAKELVRLRAHRLRLTGLKAGLSGLSQQINEVGSSQRIASTLAQTTQMMQKMNSQLSLVATHRLMKEFERQTAIITDKQGVIDDTLESAFETDNEQEQTEAAVSRVLEEAGLGEAHRMGSVTGTAHKSLLSSHDISDGALESRLNSLRNS